MGVVGCGDRPGRSSPRLCVPANGGATEAAIAPGNHVSMAVWIRLGHRAHCYCSSGPTQHRADPRGEAACGGMASDGAFRVEPGNRLPLL